MLASTKNISNGRNGVCVCMFSFVYLFIFISTSDSLLNQINSLNDNGFENCSK